MVYCSPSHEGAALSLVATVTPFPGGLGRWGGGGVGEESNLHVTGIYGAQELMFSIGLNEKLYRIVNNQTHF